MIPTCTEFFQIFHYYSQITHLAFRSQLMVPASRERLSQKQWRITWQVVMKMGTKQFFVDVDLPVLARQTITIFPTSPFMSRMTMRGLQGLLAAFHLASSVVIDRARWRGTEIRTALGGYSDSLREKGSGTTVMEKFCFLGKTYQ